MTKLELFERALCCPTGVCGPSVDEDLLMITSVFESLKNIENVEAIRYNLANNPDVFAGREEVIGAIHKNGKKALPITILDGGIVKTGEYPSKDEISELVHVDLDHITIEQNNAEEASCCGDEKTDSCCSNSEESKSSSCCGGSNCC